MTYIVTFNYCTGGEDKLIGCTPSLEGARRIARERCQSSIDGRLVDGIALIKKDGRPISRFDVVVDAPGFERIVETSVGRPFGNRTVVKRLKLTPEEAADLQRRVDESGDSWSQYVRSKLFE